MTWGWFVCAGVAWGQSPAVVIEANDRMRFNVSEVRVKARETLVIEFKNTSRIPSILHNLVILKAGTSIEAFGNAALNASDTDYVPPSMAQSVIAHTPLVKPGESMVLRFECPPPGRYEFICSFPGRFTMMKGILVVE